VIGRISRFIGTWVLILPHFGWVMVYLMLGIHHTLVWNGVFKNDRKWLFQELLWGLLRGRRCWRTLHVHGLFHLFEVSNLGEMVCIISILTTESTREVCLEVIFPPLLWLIVIVFPLGVFLASILVSPRGRFLLGVISS
jgi:hypothetical protein